VKLIGLVLLLLLTLEFGCGPGTNQGATKSSSPSESQVKKEEKIEIPGPSKTLPGFSNSTDADPKIILSEDESKSIITKNLELDDVQVEIKENPDKNGFYILLSSRLSGLSGAPLVSLRGDIDTQGRFNLYPEKDPGSDFTINGFGECYSTESSGKENRCTSLYVEIIAKVQNNYFYKQVKVPKIEYENIISEPASEPVPVPAPKIEPIPQPTAVPVIADPEEDEPENCDNPKMKKNPLCASPGRLEGVPLSIDQIVKTTYSEQQQKKKEVVQPPSNPSVEAPVKKDVKKQIVPKMQAYGSYSYGRLKLADNIDPQMGLFIKNQLDPEAIYGTTSLVNFVNAFSQEYLNLNSQKVMISNLSEKNGGPLKVLHVSHQNGLDADISYPSTVTNENMLVSVVPGKGKPGHPRGDLKIKETWELFKWIIKNSKIDLILVHPFVKNKMCQYAKEVHEMELGEKILVKLVPDSSHYNHFHVRLECQLADRLCERNKNPPTEIGCQN
jgi:murein endopeptidase